MSDKDIKVYDSEARKSVEEAEMIVESIESIPSISSKHSLDIPIIYPNFFNTDEYTTLEIPKYEVMIVQIYD